MSRARDFADLAGSADAGGITGRNLIINGAMQVAQRGTSHTYNNNESGYDSIDRIFSAAFVTGGSLAISQQTANYSGVDAEYFLRATPSGSVSAGSATIYSEYRVEDVISVSNKTFTLSFDAKAASALTFQFRRRQYYGSGGSTEEYSSFSDISVTTSWQRKTITFTIPDLSGKTIGNGSFLGLFFYWSTHQGSDNLNDAAIDITNLQLEVGEKATPFEHRSYGDELAKCKRYFNQWSDGGQTYNSLGIGTMYTNTYLQGGFELDVEMRAVPTLVQVNSSSAYGCSVHGAFPQFDTFSGLDGGTTERAVMLYRNGSITSTQGASGPMYAVSNKLALDAEL